MKAHFDAGVMVDVIASDHGWSEIEFWFGTKDVVGFYSDFEFGEMRSALGNRVRNREMTPAYPLELFAASRALLSNWVQIVTTSGAIADATDMLADSTLALRLPDAIHIAIARPLDIALVSTDFRQVRAALKLGIAVANSLETDETRP